MRMNSSKDHEARGSVYPIIPLRDVVIFPSMATAILVGRQPSVNAVERAIKTDKNLVVVTQKPNPYLRVGQPVYIEGAGQDATVIPR